ncbi:MAG: 2Fe-2S iron-sulfur cluster binding domain-containing protein [Kineosporiaceae bacterium]|nr:2Fe-2S iron-sulfur cluster binding domain-containing protein [Kineosporiaceae bacterium]
MGRIRLHPSSHLVPCEAGDTVLEALERAGYALPNNCRAGACGECRVRVRSGTFDQGFVLDMALSSEDRRAGFGLMCMAKLTGEEIEIEWGTVDARPTMFPTRENLPFVLVDSVARTPRIRELVLRPLAEPLRFWPGQYVRLGDPEAGVPRRSYSLATAAHPDGELRLHVTRVDGGRTSAWLHALAPGVTLELSGPHGGFVGDPSVATPVLCLAAGSGLAPIRSLTEAALRRGFAPEVTLVFSARAEEDLYERGLLRYWQARHATFHYVPTLTRERVPGIRFGHIPDVLPGLLPSLAGHSVFIAGRQDFVDACRAVVEGLGAKPHLVHVEGFHAQPDDPLGDHGQPVT